MIVHVVPVRQVRTFMVSPHDPTIFALLFRSKAGSICLAVKCREVNNEQDILSIEPCLLPLECGSRTDQSKSKRNLITQ